MPLPLAATSGGIVIAAFVVVMILVLAYSFYTIKGSAIDAHPSDGLDGSPGSQGPSSVAKGRGSEGGGDGDSGTFSTHGTG